MKYTLMIALIFVLGFQTSAQVVRGPDRDNKIKSLFNDIKKISKGALGLNIYQTTTGRVVVMQNGVILGAPANNQMSVAFRNEKAKALANLDFYVGNRYSSNYWELHNAYLSTPEEQAQFAFNINPPALKAKTEGKAMAFSMAKHQMLELYYMQKNPTSSLTKSYNQRGVADVDNEIKFYGLMADYLAANTQNDNDYLVYIEFQKRSSLLPGKRTASLEKIRSAVADVSTKFDAYLPAVQADDFRSLRNSIHNGMAKTVIALLKSFVAANATLMQPDDQSALNNLIAMISSYYAVDKETMSVLLPKIKTDLPEAASLIGSLQSGGNSLATLVKLSELAVAARLKFFQTRNIDLTHLIIRIQDFVQAEMGQRNLMTVADFSTQGEALLNLSYATGYLTEARKTELIQALKTNPGNSVSLLSQSLSEGVSLLENVFQPALNDWKLVSPSMTSFVDDGIRSSALISLDSTLTKLRVLLPSAGKTNSDFSIENSGVGYGYLVFIPRDKTEQMVQTLTYKMIPVFEMLPLDLGVVAGVITEEPQTPLSHVNIKSKNRGTPNVFIKKASQDSRVKDLLAKKALVRMELKDGVISLREVPQPEAEAYWSARHDNKPIIKLRADLNEKRIRSTKEMGFNDAISVGAKAANYAEATHVLPEAFRSGFAIPFFYYREFIETNKFDAQLTIDQYIKQLMADPRIKTDRAYLVDSLTKLQARMNADDMVVNPALIAEIKRVTSAEYPNMRVRLRSSTNSEDMPQFTGAGLYDSGAYDPNKPKKTVDKALKFVWSSVWNLRAFDERELFQMNHLEVSMAMLISPAFPNEIANGVGVGRNIIDPKLGPGLYLNIQQGAEAVTNPNPDLTPDQVLVLFKPDLVAKTKYTLKYLKYSSLTKTGPVLPYAEVEKIADYLLALQKHFYPIYYPKKDHPNFSLDVEFKVDTEEGPRKVHYKQARPFIGN